MSLAFWDHVVELRGRLIKVLTFFLVCSFLFYPSTQFTLQLLIRPIGKLYFLAPADAFLARWSVAMLGGFLFSLPFSCYQVWGFISEGLNLKERRLVLSTLPWMGILFVGGMVFSFYVVLPFVLQFLLSFSSVSLQQMLTLDHYVSFTLSLFLVFGIAFELPIVMFIAVKLNAVSLNFLRAQRSWVIVGILFTAAFITPPDIVSQLMLSLPLYVLYELGLIVAWFFKEKG